MKLFAKKYIVPVVSAVLILTLSACSFFSEEKSVAVLNEYKSDSDFDTQVRSQEKYEIGSKGNFTAYLYPATATLAVEDGYGNVWTTNPLDALEKESTTNIANAQSQIRVTYFDDQYKTVTLDSFTECVEKEKISYYKTEKGLGVNYYFGEKNKIFLAPKIMSKERYEQISAALDSSNLMLFQAFYQYTTLEGITDSTGKATLKETYPILEEYDVYTLQAAGMSYEMMSDDILQRVNDILVSAGYTQKDLEKDNELDLNKKSGLKKVQISLAVEYELTDSGLSACIPSDSISFDPSAITLTEIELLPYFCSADTKDSGYMLIPDLSGALVRLNNGKKDFSYKKQVYGKESTLVDVDSNIYDSGKINKSEIYLPVFGQTKIKSGYLAVIEKGSAYAEINCRVSNEFSVYNQIFALFNIQNFEEKKLAYNGSQILYAAQKNMPSDDMSVNYILLAGENVDYNTMASAYKKYLKENLLVKENSGEHSLLGVNVISSVSTKKSVAGIPVAYNKAVTDFTQSQKLIEILKDKKIENFDYNIFSWCNNGLSNTSMKKVDIIKNVGNKNELKRLLSLSNKDLPIYMAVNFSSVSKAAANKKYAAKNLNGLITEIKNFENENDTDSYLINTRFMPDLIQGFIKSYESKIAHGNIYDFRNGSMLNGDYSDTPTDRQESIDNIEKSLKLMSDKGYNLKFSGGNSYVLKYASALDNIETDNTGNYLFDASVPFFQLVVGDFIPCYSTPLNYKGNYRSAMLGCIESGTIPAFEWIFAENSEISDCKENLYSANYEAWLDKAKEIYDIFLEIQALTAKTNIVSHEIISDSFTLTRYDNGCCILVNRSNTAKEYNGFSVASQDYKIMG